MNERARDAADIDALTEAWAEKQQPATVRPAEAHDPVAAPIHYRSHPSGVECITIAEHMSFCLGNAMKYIWRADHKNGLEDLRKSVWYLKREIARRERSLANALDGRD
jgi:hypothetical protein